MFKRGCIYCPDLNDPKRVDLIDKAYEYCKMNSIIITRSFEDTQQMLDCHEDYDIVISVGGTLMLPLAIEIINIF